MVKKTPEMEEFVKSLGLVEDIGLKLNEIPQEGRTPEHDKKRDSVKDAAYKDAVAIGIVNPAIVPNAGAWNDQVAFNYAQTYLLPKLDNEASNTLRNDLEKVIAGVEDDKLENLVGSDLNDKNGALLPEYLKGKGYDDWLNNYREYAGNKDLAQRAGKKQISQEEANKLLNFAADRVEKKIVNDHKEYHRGVKDAVARLAKDFVLRGEYGDPTELITAEAKALADASEKEFSAYEKDPANKGKSARGYVETAYKEIVKDQRTDRFNAGKSRLYNAIK